ncbi:MAG: Ig-like domain-containing protein [Nanoarchaeota archaeon]
MRKLLFAGLGILLLIQAAWAITVLNLQDSPLSQTSERFTWQTDEPGTSVIEYGLVTPVHRVESNELSTSHSLDISSLLPGRKYFYRASSCTALPECNTVEGNFDALTISDPEESNVSAVGARIGWATNRALNAKLKYGTDPNALTEEVVFGESAEPSIGLSGLSANTQYYYEAYAGNVATRTQSFWTSADLVVAHVALDTQPPAMTNDPVLALTGGTESLTKMRVFLNNDFVPAQLSWDGGSGYTYDVGPSGRFQFSLRLRSGQNKVTFEVTDSAYNVVHEDITVQLDTQGPDLDVDFPPASQERSVKLVSQISKAADISVYLDKPFGSAVCDSSCGTAQNPWCCQLNQQKFGTEQQCQTACTLTPDITMQVQPGNFNITLPGQLAEGRHNVSVSARDSAGNIAQVSGVVAVDTTAPKILRLRIEEALIGIGTDQGLDLGGAGGSSPGSASDDTVHFQVIRISGNVSEHAHVRIIVLGNDSSGIKYNRTDKCFYNRRGERYSVSIQGDLGDLFLDYDETVETDANNNFEAEVVLIPGTNHIAIIVMDDAGNDNAKSGGAPEITRVRYDPGSPFWVLQTHSISPNYIISGDLVKGDLPLGIMVKIIPTILDRSRLKVTSIDASVADRDRYSNRYLAMGTRPTMIWEEDTQELYAYIPLVVKKWLGDDVNDIPDPLEFELKVTVHYTCEGCYMHEDFPGSDYLWLKESVDVDRPIDYRRWLTPEIMDKLIANIHGLNNAIGTVLDVVKPVTRATMIGCAALVVYNKVKEATGGWPDLKKQYWVCDRIGCPKTPPNFDAETFKNTLEYTSTDGNSLGNTNPKDGTVNQIKFKQDVGNDELSTVTLEHTNNRGTCAEGLFEVKIKNEGQGSVNILGVPISLPGVVSQNQNSLCTNQNRKDFFDNIEATAVGTITKSKGFYYETTKDDYNPPYSFASGATSGPMKNVLGEQLDRTKLDFHQTKCLINYYDGVPDKATWGDVNPLDDLFASSGCVCLSGMENHLGNMQRVFNSFEKCFQQAKEGKVTVGYCENIIGMYTCDFIFWGLSKALDLHGPTIGANFGGRTTNPAQSANLVTSGLKDRYPTQIGSQLGFGTSSLAHKACQAAVSQDWSSFRAQVDEVIETMPVEPQIMPLLAESRVYSLDPFTGMLTIKYLFTPAIFSGGQTIEWEVWKICDKNQPDGDFCPQQPVEAKAGGGVVMADQEYTDFVEDWDKEAVYWFNRAELRLRYKVGDEWRERRIPGKITHIGGMIANCFITGNIIGPAIGCSVPRPESVGGLEFQSIRVTPGVDTPATTTQTYYPGNAVNVLIKARAFQGFDDENVVLAYYTQDKETDPYWVKIPGDDFADGQALVHLFTVPDTIGSHNVAYAVVEDAELAKLNAALQERDVTLYAYEGDYNRVIPDDKIKYKWQFSIPIIVPPDVNEQATVEGSGKTILKNTVLTKLTITAQSSNARIPIFSSSFDGSSNEDYLFSLQALACDFPFRVDGTSQVFFKLFKDNSGNGYSNDDPEIKYRGEEQKKQLAFNFKSFAPSCTGNPAVEIIWPLANMFCNDKVDVQLTSLDDCNQENIDIKAKTNRQPTLATLQSFSKQDPNTGIYRLAPSYTMPTDTTVDSVFFVVESTIKDDTKQKGTAQVTVAKEEGSYTCTLPSEEQPYSPLDEALKEQNRQFLRDVLDESPPVTQVIGEDRSDEDGQLSSGPAIPNNYYGTGSIVVQNEIIEVATRLGVPPKVALGVAAVENSFKHCVDGDLYREHCERTSIGSSSTGCIGVMQICTDRDRCKDTNHPPDALCNVDECTEKTVYDRKCNIAMGVNHLLKYYNELLACPDNCGCEDSLGRPYSSYLGKNDGSWDITIRRYNGYGCDPPYENDFVILVHEKMREFETLT